MKRFELPSILLSIAESFPEETRDSEISKGSDSIDLEHPVLQKYLKLIRSNFTRYSFTDEEIVLVAILFENFLKCSRRVDSIQLAERLYPGSIDRLQALIVLQKLMIKGVVDARGISRRAHTKLWRIFGEELEDSSNKYSIVQLVRSEVIFREDFLQELLDAKRRSQLKENHSYSSNQEFLEGWFAYIKALYDFKSSKSYSLDSEQDLSEEIAVVRDTYQIHKKRLVKTIDKFPLQSLVEDEELDDSERDIVLYLLREEMEDNNCSVDELIKFISEDRFDQYKKQQYFDPKSKLVSRAIVQLEDESGYRSDRSQIRLSPDISRRILTREPQGDEERMIEILRGQDLLELETPDSSLDEVVLSRDLKHTLRTAVKRYQSRVDLKLRSWGIDKSSNNRLVDENDEAPLLLLFSGPSGTGKTLSAGAFAKHLDRKLLITDISRILSCWVGQSEQNVRRLFYLFDRMIRRLEKPPILLLNECDQFLATRGKASRSVDRMYNQMQNLFLESFERLRGIMIATTNLSDNLDPAFSRRFHLKLDFQMPNQEEQMAIWKLHIPSTMPVAADVDVKKLSNKYQFSGGQIALAVRNAAIEAAVQGSEVNMQHLARACETEESGSLKPGSLKTAIGFNS